MSTLLQELPTNNTKQMRIFLSQHFYPTPQLLGGNHSTAAFKKILQKHQKVKSGETYFKTPTNSKLTPESLKKFVQRSVHFVISPLPYDECLKTTRVKHGLLCLARQLNDNAKQVKSATLCDQLKKARGVLESFLRNEKDPSAKKIYFKEKESVWPNSHADLQKNIYSAKGIQKEVAKVLSQEFFSSVSAIKLVCTCPDDVFELLLKITSFQTTGKKPEEIKNVVNSTKSIAVFTLNYCSKAALIQTLTNIYANLLETGGKKFNLSIFAALHTERVNFIKMLNVIVTDMNSNVNDNRMKKFLKEIGTPNEEGFYEELNFQNVS